MGSKREKGCPHKSLVCGKDRRFIFSKTGNTGKRVGKGGILVLQVGHGPMGLLVGYIHKHSEFRSKIYMKL